MAQQGTLDENIGHCNYPLYVCLPSNAFDDISEQENGVHLSCVSYVDGSEALLLVHHQNLLIQP